LIYFGVAKLGEAPSDGITEVDPDGLTAGNESLILYWICFISSLWKTCWDTFYNHKIWWIDLQSCWERCLFASNAWEVNLDQVWNCFSNLMAKICSK